MTADPVVLYVEDNEQSREILLFLLTEVMGYSRVRAFEDSRDFMQRVLALEPLPDLFLLDIHVPPHDGLEMLRMLRAHPQFACRPVVALTASVMSEEVSKLKDHGFDSIIPKPIDIDRFPTILQQILAGERFWNVVY